MLQTQFWDTAPVTGPTTSWTVHGLWPDHCDGTFDASCDSTRYDSTTIFSRLANLVTEHTLASQASSKVLAKRTCFPT